MRDVARAEAERLHAELDPIMADARADRKHIDRAEAAKQAREITEADLAEQQQTYNARQAERRAQTEAARGRLARAEEVISVCEIRAQQYGDDVRLTSPASWEPAAAARAAAPTVRALVPA